MQDDPINKPHAIIVMGVSGCGKSSVGEKLAEALHLAFVEGDALHPASNVEKMSKGIPLTDEDRMPWLDLIGKRMHASLEKGEGIIVSCSALKRIYRERLRAAAGGNLFFIYLEGSKALLTKRMGERKGHFMPVSLLESQLATLEVPTGEQGVVTVDIDDTVDGIAATALRGLSTLGVMV
ncbi:gluconokinase [Rhizobium lentis]|uniref:Gluconokinase n=1 Tax=Rhizobium lentis TaxID=1138194 RepID=A0A7W8XHT6_9HYPH|nr:gluconokinase [Rhizobium lentis]MBB4575977.1 gluconokinase [Rhizobium lentis]MBB5552286.1 gluconokinase [Rhizobium lentis]MBB5563105.1 gluconokinase [Rhizobium lentis]MBB5569103.1 gluconokinase [Rhizobium lentis]